MNRDALANTARAMVIEAMLAAGVLRSLKSPDGKPVGYRRSVTGFANFEEQNPAASDLAARALLTAIGANPQPMLRGPWGPAGAIQPFVS